MHWLDLGWLKREGGWEFHPWGFLSRGYLLGEGEAKALRPRVRRIRGMVVAGVLACAILSAWRETYGPLVALLLFGTCLEAFGIWTLVKGLPRTEQALGWEAGLVYLARWVGPKLLTVARVLTVLLVAAALYLVWQTPGEWTGYLFLGFFVAVLYLLHYLEAVQQSKG